MQHPAPLPTPCRAALCASKPQESADEGFSRGFLSAAHLAAAQAQRAANRQAWSALALRQDFHDEALMRAHLKVAGLRIPDRQEPATLPRLRQVLRRAGVLGVHTDQALGSDGSGPIGLAGYLERNPGLPLWAAVALVLELCGSFTARALRELH